MKTETEILALEHFMQLIIASKNKDAALSAFDRRVKANEYSSEVETSLRQLFQPIRDERFKKRQFTDIGGTVDKIKYSRADVDANVRVAKTILKEANLNRADDVLLSLLLMTGRRTSEITGTTIFKKDSFTGTLKGGNETGAANYLCDVTLINKGIKTLAVNGWRNLTPEKSNALVAVPLMRRLPIIFKAVDKVHDLRKLHMAICIDRLKKMNVIKKMSPKNRAEYLGKFINDSLGHSNPSSAIPYLNSQIYETETA